MGHNQWSRLHADKLVKQETQHGRALTGLSLSGQKSSAAHNGNTGHEKHRYYSTLDVQGRSPGCLGLRLAIVYSPVQGRLRGLTRGSAVPGARILPGAAWRSWRLEALVAGEPASKSSLANRLMIVRALRALGS